MPSEQAQRRRGGIRERGGVFQVRVHVGTDPVTGQRVDLTGTATTEREAEKLLTRFLAEKDARRAARSRITLGKACDRWLANLEVEVKTKHEYTGYVLRTLRPALAPCRSRAWTPWRSRACTPSSAAAAGSAGPAARRSITGRTGSTCVTRGVGRTSAVRSRRRQSERCTRS